MKKNLLIKLRDALLKLNDIKTDKGTLVFEGELEVGTEVMIEDIDGNWIEAPDGEYRSETEVIVVEAGKVVEIKKDEEPIPAPEAEEAPEEEPVEIQEEEEQPAEEPAEEPAEDKDAYIAELEARIAELEAINAELEAENADLKSKLDEAEVSLKASAAKPAKEEFKNEEKQPLVHRRKFY